MKCIVYIGTSLDGFIARENGDIDWLVHFQNKDVFNSYNEFIKSIDAIVIGRGTYEKVLGFPDWPYEKKVFILSKTITEVPDKINEKASILNLKPKELLEHLAKQGYKSLYIDGGNVIQSFLKEDCIDEMIITKVPVLIGSGIALFGQLANDLLFEHSATKVFADGLVSSHYIRKRT